MEWCHLKIFLLTGQLCFGHRSVVTVLCLLFPQLKIEKCLIFSDTTCIFITDFIKQQSFYAHVTVSTQQTCKNKFVYAFFQLRWFSSLPMEAWCRQALMHNCFDIWYVSGVLRASAWENQVVGGTWRLSKSIHSWCGRCTWWLTVMCKFTPF